MNALENKIPPPLVALIITFAMWGLSIATPVFEFGFTMKVIAVVFLWLIGSFFCFSGIVSFKKAQTTVNPLKPETASSLVSSGIYQVSRNPMYVGFVFLLLAWAALGVIPVFILFIHRFQIVPEERALTEIFGSEFTSYQSAVRRWL